MAEIERPEAGAPPESRGTTEVPSVEPVPLEPGTVEAFLAWAGRSGYEERETVREAIHASGGHDEVVSELFERLERTIELADLGVSVVILGILGELRAPAAVKRLAEFVRQELPDDSPGHGALGARDTMEILQSKAVEGIAYLGDGWSDEAVREIIANHPSAPVRAAAIDAYLYNHGDDPAALEDVVAKQDRPFLHRPRQTRDLDQRDFNERLERFQEMHPEARPERPEPAKEAREDDDRLDEEIEPPKPRGG